MTFKDFGNAKSQKECLAKLNGLSENLLKIRLVQNVDYFQPKSRFRGKKIRNSYSNAAVKQNSLCFIHLYFAVFLLRGCSAFGAKDE